MACLARRNVCNSFSVRRKAWFEANGAAGGQLMRAAVAQVESPEFDGVFIVTRVDHPNAVGGDVRLVVIS